MCRGITTTFMCSTDLSVFTAVQSNIKICPPIMKVGARKSQVWVHGHTMNKKVTAISSSQTTVAQR